MNYQSPEPNANSAEEASSVPEAIALELRTLWHGLIRASECAARVDRQQFWVLSATECKPMRMSQLAASAQTSQASLTGIVDRLEDHGLVERVRSSEDRRVVDVSLTPAGREELDRVRLVFTEHLEATLSPLSPEERAAFLGVLRTLNAHAAWKCERR
jgi:DNA-binding MarR family transcriptional regulator